MDFAYFNELCARARNAPKGACITYDPSRYNPATDPSIFPLVRLRTGSPSGWHGASRENGEQRETPGIKSNYAGQPTNPKDQAATDRCPLHLLPAVGRIHGAHACKDGADKYGAYNWREEAISLMGYTSAIERHLMAIRDGQDVDPKSGCTHLGHIIAGASIILDAAACGTLIDDRPDVEGGAPLALMDYIKQARGE